MTVVSRKHGSINLTKYQDGTGKALMYDLEKMKETEYRIDKNGLFFANGTSFMILWKKNELWEKVE